MTALDTAKTFEQITKEVTAQSGHCNSIGGHVDAVHARMSSRGHRVRSQGQGAKSGIGRGKSAREQGQATGSRGRGHSGNSRAVAQHHDYQGVACKNCGAQHSGSTLCPAKGRICRKCHQRNHYASVCQSYLRSTNPRVREVEAGIADIAIEDFSIDEVIADVGDVEITDACIADDSKAWLVDLAMYGRTVKFKLDTGADISIMPKQVYQSLRSPPELQPSKIRLVSASKPLSAVGAFIARATSNEQTYRFRVVVTEGTLSGCLLSQKVSEAMGFVVHQEPQNVVRSLNEADTPRTFWSARISENSAS